MNSMKCVMWFIENLKTFSVMNSYKRQEAVEKYRYSLCKLCSLAVELGVWLVISTDFSFLKLYLASISLFYDFILIKSVFTFEIDKMRWNISFHSLSRLNDMVRAEIL